jgi:hypothetical protein
VFSCVEHGEIKEVIASKATFGEGRKLTEKWRDQQREKMMRMTPAQIEGVIKTRKFVRVRSVSIIVETDEGAFLKVYRTDAKLMTYKANDGVVHEDSDNMVVQADIRFLDEKCIQEPTGWVFQPRPKGK